MTHKRSLAPSKFRDKKLHLRDAQGGSLMRQLFIGQFSAFVYVSGLVFFGAFASAKEPTTLESDFSKFTFVGNFLTPISYEMHPVQDTDASFAAQITNITDDCRGPRLTDESITGVDDLNEIIAVGEKLWKLIEAGRPVVTFRAPVVHAVPLANICWTELESWRPPVSQMWEVNYKNAYGMNVVKFRFRVVYTAGGKYDGVGSYLANVTVMPASLEASWGYTVNAETIVGRAINLGTKTNPIAGLQLMVTWNVKTIVKDLTHSESIFIRGDK